jgi:hypothetical protein
MEPIVAVCRRLHLRVERNATGMAKGVKSPNQWIHLHSSGMWDLEVYLPAAGCTVMVECKMPGGELDPEQAEWGRVYRACGKETIVATSVQQFLVELDAIKRRRANGTPQKGGSDGT